MATKSIGVASFTCELVIVLLPVHPLHLQDGDQW
jgi:hypothetical protein